MPHASEDNNPISNIVMYSTVLCYFEGPCPTYSCQVVSLSLCGPVRTLRIMSYEYNYLCHHLTKISPSQGRLPVGTLQSALEWYRYISHPGAGFRAGGMYVLTELVMAFLPHPDDVSYTCRTNAWYIPIIYSHKVHTCGTVAPSRFLRQVPVTMTPPFPLTVDITEATR